MLPVKAEVPSLPCRCMGQGERIRENIQRRSGAPGCRRSRMCPSVTTQKVPQRYMRPWTAGKAAPIPPRQCWGSFGMRHSNGNAVDGQTLHLRMGTVRQKHAGEWQTRSKSGWNKCPSRSRQTGEAEQGSSFFGRRSRRGERAFVPRPSLSPLVSNEACESKFASMSRGGLIITDADFSQLLHQTNGFEKPSSSVRDSRKLGRLSVPFEQRQTAKRCREALAVIPQAEPAPKRSTGGCARAGSGKVTWSRLSGDDLADRPLPWWTL